MSGACLIVWLGFLPTIIAGILNDVELNGFQSMCFSQTLSSDELEGVKAVCVDAFPFFRSRIYWLTSGNGVYSFVLLFHERLDVPLRWCEAVATTGSQTTG